MSARSMTGFARVRRAIGTGEIVLSVKSVNHRGLDVHFHMPAMLDPFEANARAAVKQHVSRGHVQVHVSMDRATPGSGGSLDPAALARWLGAFREAAEMLGSNVEPNPHEVIRTPGVLSEKGVEWSTSLEQTLGECIGEALRTLNEFRQREGDEIAGEMRERVNLLLEAVNRMQAIRAKATDAFHRRLQERLGELLRGHTVEPQRLAQEAAVLAERSDISEEIMRLQTHATQLLALLDGEGEKGKKLDFLLQEMNRESNTILSKTSGLGDYGLTLTNLGLSAKAEIDKMREQALNLE